jgi:hypothetical protein
VGRPGAGNPLSHCGYQLGQPGCVPPLKAVASATQSALRLIVLFSLAHCPPGHFLVPGLRQRHLGHFWIRMRPLRRSTAVEWARNWGCYFPIYLLNRFPQNDTKRWIGYQSNIPRGRKADNRFRVSLPGHVPKDPSAIRRSVHLAHDI